MKHILIYTLVMAACSVLHAQVIIPRVGITLSRTNAEDEAFVEQKFNTGFLLGAAAEWSLNSSVSIQPEFNFIQKGFRLLADVSEQGLSIKVDNRTTINYLELPVLVKYYFNDSDTRVYMIAGPSIGIGLGGNVKSKVDTDLFGTKLSVTVKGKVKFREPPPGFDPLEDGDIYFDNRLDVGLQGGIGVLIKEMLLIELRYNHGLSRLFEDEDKSMNRVIQLSVGMPFTAIRKLTTK